MFVGRPSGNYDRLLDFSRAVTGTLFFVPSATFLESMNGDTPAAAIPDPESTLEPAPLGPEARDGSLGVGSLKGEIRYE
jgi:putative iron-dependent peroxidase